MKKLKGFTLVELIVVLAIFSMIMAAVLSILQPVSDAYASTANYEHARASSDNVRTYVEDSLRYADRMKILINASSLSEAEGEASAMISGFKNADGSDRIATGDTPVYIMELNNNTDSENRMGYVNVYQYTNGTSMTSSVFKSINTNLYDQYGYNFKICNDPSCPDPDCLGNFTEMNSQMQLEIFKYNVKTSSYEDTTYSTTITFSMLNIRDRTEQFEIRYDADGNEVVPGQAGYDDASIICPVDKKCYQGIVDKGTGNNIYFIYTLPKYSNQYS